METVLNNFCAEGLNVLSLFDGMSCGQLALQKAGIKVNQYYAAEIDKYAMQVTQKNFPNTIQLGDVTKVKIKLLCLSEVYSYLCTHDTDLQSKISEQEMLHWLNEEYTISTDFGTQKQNEGQAIRQPSALQCFEKIRISKCGMGSFLKAQNISRGGVDGDKTHIGNSFKLQCGEWWYGDDIQRGDKEKNITGAIREAENGNLQTENIGNPKGKISGRKRKEVDFTENEKSNVDKGGEKKLSGRSEENKLNGEVGKEESNGGVEANRIIENLISTLQSWHETNGTSETYRNFLRLHSQEQITVVEYAAGLKIFKGKIDLLCGGSPCQGFSFAGKGLNFEDERSKLFFEFVRLINECKPKWFFLENVKMKKEHELVISQYMKVAPIEINSALVSAQNRVRLYWTNINEKPYGLFGDMMADIPQPKDKGILLKDILETDVPDKFYLSDKMLQYFSNRAANFNQGKVNVREEEGKASCLTSSMASCDISDNFIKVDTNLKKSANQDKANCFTAGGNSGGLHSDMTLIVASRGRNPENPKSREIGLNTEQHLEPRFDNKTNTLTSVQKDNLLLVPEATKKGFIEVAPGECFDFENPNSETRRGRKMETKSNCLMAKETDFVQFTLDKRLRRLTPTECERLQTVPDGYTNYVSDTQRYRMLGNGWTVDVIAYIFGYMRAELSKCAGC